MKPPLSSPGRTEKFPPPLMRFLRSNVGSKSRGGRRSSPMMFMRKKNAAIDTQEPSSPKVTCIGQVRNRRRRRRSPTRRRCRWIRTALFFPCFRTKPKSNSSSIFRKWASFFRYGFRTKPKIRTNSPPCESPFHGGAQILDSETQVFAAVNDDEEESTTKVLISSNSSPPKNALLLTRCRSAPYRSTSLANRFWGFENQEIEEQTNNGRKSAEIEEPKSQIDSISDRDPIGGFEFDERMVKSGSIEGGKTEEGEEDIGGSSRPLILTRCKSEPSRMAEKMNLEVGFWKKTRLGIPDSCLPNNL